MPAICAHAYISSGRVQRPSLLTSAEMKGRYLQGAVEMEVNSVSSERSKEKKEGKQSFYLGPGLSLGLIFLASLCVVGVILYNFPEMKE